MVEIKYANERFTVTDQSSVDILRRGHFGSVNKSRLTLSPEEALYLIDMRNAECLSSNGSKLHFNDVAAKFWKSRKFTARYFTYKDWRDRGLIIKPNSLIQGPSESAHLKEYPKAELNLGAYKLKGVFFKSDLITIVEGGDDAKSIYENLWLGQYGSYKASERGILNKLDIYETMFLIGQKVLSVTNEGRKAIEKTATSRRRDFPKLYEVYKDWRSKGYVVKTGFKFGTHFRIYFPGARPVSENGAWIHSKHVLQIFPKEARLLISEWARAIRVAHSVRKTFILAIPGKASKKKVEIDYVLYHRNGGVADTPESASPKYAMLAINEEDYIGGNELAGAIREAKESKMELMLAIVDRETAVTYYKVRQIELQNTKHDYYEIDWMQP